MKTHIVTCILSIGLTTFGAPELPERAPGRPAALPVPASPVHPEIAPVPPPPLGEGFPAPALAALKLAQAPAAPRPPKGDIFLSHSRGGRTLIIQSSDPDPKTYANLEEDLSVMYRILSKTRKQEEGMFKLESFLSGSSSSVKSMYIEGYGAVFMLGVRFPLVAPQAAEEQPKPKDTTSEEWERAKKEVFGRNTFEVDFEGIMGKLNAQAEEYDAHKVEDLTAGILEGLKNATHIRNLKSDEFVTVAVLGAEAGQVRAVVEKEERGQEGGKRSMRIENVSGGRGESTMTIRAKKSDIDDFAKGKLNADAFRKKAKILVYLRPLDASGKMNVFAPARQ